jgi:X-X-X-Leu-X-X-Gly heptad repeat protein
LAKQDQITTVTTGLKGDAADKMTDQARALADTYNVDFREAINAANTLMTQFGETGEQSMQLIKDGMQGMIQGDGPKLLSMIQQYAPSFRDAGVSASQLVAVIQNSEGGIFTDQNMNAIVMGIKNIRLMTKATSDALKQMGIDGDKMSQELSDGTLTVFDALKQVAGGLRNVDSNSMVAGEVMQQVFGRQGVTAGSNLGKAIEQLNLNLEETKKQTGEVGDAYNDLYNANVKLNGAIRDCFEYDGWDQMATGIKANLVSALASVLDFLGRIKGALGGFSVNQQQGGAQTGGGANMDRMIAMLGDGKSPKAQQTYTRQIQEYTAGIFRVNDQIRQIQEKAAQDMDGNMSLVYEKQIRNLENRKAAIRKNMAEYERRAKQVLNAPTDTKTPITPIDPPKKTTKGTTPKEQASKVVTDAELAYSQTINKARLEMESGLKTDADVKKANLSAQERLYDAYGKAYATYADPKYKEAQDKAAEEIKKLGGEVKTATDAQKLAEQAARELAASQKKQKEATDKAIAAAATNNLGDFYKNNKAVIAAGSAPVSIPVGFTYTDSNLQAFIGNLKERIGQSEVGSDLYNALTKQLADANMLGNFISLAVKNGIDVADIEPQKLWSKIFGDGQTAGDYIPDNFWDGLGEQFKESLGKGISIDTKTGEVKEGKKEDDGFKKFNEGMTKLTSGLSQVSSGLKSVGIDVPKEVDQVIGVINGVSQVITGVSTIISIFGTTAIASNTTAVGLNTAAIASLIFAIETNTASNFIPFAGGGIVPKFDFGGIIPKFAGGGLIGKAAGGMLIPGNSFSGDNLRMPVDGGQGWIGVNSGELILNKAQQNNLANALSDDESRSVGGGTPYVQGELIYLGVNNYLKRSGRGEIVTSKRG